VQENLKACMVYFTHDDASKVLSIDTSREIELELEEAESSARHSALVQLIADYTD